MPSIYETCQELYRSSPDAILQCITNAYEENQNNNVEDLIHWFLVLCGSMVFFMQTGFAMICAGCVRKKNLQNTMLKNFLDVCGAAVAFYTVGYAFAYGGQYSGDSKRFIGNQNFFGTNIHDSAFWFFQFACSATAATIVAGTLAERCRMSAYLCYSAYLSGFVYPVVAHAMWSRRGFFCPDATNPLFGVGAVDFSGSGVVHVTGGMTALVATLMLGPRRGRFHDLKTGEPLAEPKEIPGHSIALQTLGTLMLWFGWYGFNPGSALLREQGIGPIAARVTVNTSLSGASGAICTLAVSFFSEKKKGGEAAYNLTAALNGLLSGLVSISAGCGTVDSWASVVIGCIGGFLYFVAANGIVRLRIDDVVDAIPVHLIAGTWGVIATGLFTTREFFDATFHFQTDHVGLFFSGSFRMLGAQLLALVYIVTWVTATMWPFFWGLNKMGWLRSGDLEELVGLDHIYHGGAYIETGAGSDIRNELTESLLREATEPKSRTE